MPGEKTVLNFAVAVDASADVPLLAWFDLDDEWLTKARQIHDGLAKSAERAETLPRGSVLQRGDVVIGPPVPRPGKIICIGINYKDHAAESNMPVPKSPISFSKYVTSVVGPDRPIRLPAVSQQVDYEAEMAIVIGRRAKHVAVERAFDHVLGYMNLNDVSARDLQFADGQWQRGKACDTFAPMGPWIADRTEVPDPHVLELRTWVNGTKLQDGNSKNLIFNINYLVAFLSAKMTLLPGDLVITGTPAGVGFTRKPPVLLKGGDRVRMEITGLGTLDNPVVEA
jgi:2-keto-4-pentenoate hydratase/2-oxohepta-3-ene-1,7-dioic acid hydratase (catechol pathway)